METRRESRSGPEGRTGESRLESLPREAPSGMKVTGRLSRCTEQKGLVTKEATARSPEVSFWKRASVQWDRRPS